MSNSNDETLPDGCMWIIGVFLLLLAALFIYNNATYRYRITVSSGDTTTSYYTDGYVRRGDCVYFREGNTQDSTQVCGVYRVRQINP